VQAPVLELVETELAWLLQFTLVVHVSQQLG
jgi:hypothetical protein